ncbi:PfkB family carbohydrate kinase [Pseudomonas sp. R2.Fl]|nr:PfkB family carbohydrate kinase [Pseudomonas sp. R2.Fl]
MDEPRLFHIGSAVIDFIYRVERLPLPGDDLLASSFSALPGGGFNMLLAARRSGMASAYAGRIGTGPAGAMLEAAFRAEDIACVQDRVPGHDTGTCIVLVTPDGERTFVSHQGAEALVSFAGLEAIPARTGDWFFTSGYTLVYPQSRDAQAAFITGLPGRFNFMLDPTGVVAEIPRPVLDPVLARADWLTLNRSEARAIAGEGDASVLAARLLSDFCPRAKGVILRCGAEGALLALRNSKQLFVPAFEVETVDTNGAGDVHAGAFVAALAHGRDPAGALLYANAAAAISTMRHGGSVAPTREDVEEFLKVPGKASANQ